METGGESGIHSLDLNLMLRRHLSANRHLLPLHHPLPPDAAPSVTPSPRGGKGYCHGAMKHVVPFMFGLLVLKYQSKPDTLFHHYAAYFWCSVVSTCIYWLILQPIRHLLEADAVYWFQILNRVEPAFALLSVSSLLSVLLPHHIAWLPLVLWTFVPIASAWPLYCCVYTWACFRIDSIITRVLGFCEAGGGNSEEVPGEGNSEDDPGGGNSV